MRQLESFFFGLELLGLLFLFLGKPG